MISGLDLSATEDYSLKDDVDPKTVWKLGIIPSYLFAKISADANKREVETSYKILQLALKGWENFNIPFELRKEKVFDQEVDVVPMFILDKLPFYAVTELVVKIMQINQISGSERKNS